MGVGEEFGNQSDAGGWDGCGHGEQVEERGKHVGGMFFVAKGVQGDDTELVVLRDYRIGNHLLDDLELLLADCVGLGFLGRYLEVRGMIVVASKTLLELANVE